MARQLVVTPELEKKVLMGIYRGKSVDGVCKELGLDDWTVMQHLARSEELTRTLAHARASYLTTQLHELDQVIYDMNICPQRARLKVDLVKWELTKVLPKVYGDRMTHDVNVQVDLSGAIAEAESRLKRRTELHDDVIDDAEIIEPDELSFLG